MYAIIRSGGKQHRVEPGQVIQVERLELNEGSAFETDQVLLVEDGSTLKIGAPVVNGAKVSGTVVGHGRAKKILVFKMKRRKSYRRTQGHRQHFTRIKINSITL